MAKIYSPSDSELRGLNTQIGTLQNKVFSSPSYGGDTPPTPGEVSQDLSLTALKDKYRTLMGQKNKERWYGKTKATNTDSPENASPENLGFLGNVLTRLQQPLYAVTGTVEHMTGQGEKTGLLENIQENMNTGHNTFGDVYKRAGMPKWISAPLGFFSDIAFDPVNIATSGTESLVGKIGMGFKRGLMRDGLSGAMEAVKTGAASSVGSDLLKTTKFIPFKSKMGMTPEWLEMAGQKVYSQADRYNLITGRDPIAKLGEGIASPFARMAGKEDLFSTKGTTMGSFLEDRLAQTDWGKKLIEKFKYDPYTWTQVAKLKDRVIKMMETTGETSLQNEKMVNSMDKLGEVKPGIDTLNKPTAGAGKEVLTQERLVNIEKTKEEEDLINRIGEGIDDSDYIASQKIRGGSDVITDNAAQFEERMFEEGQKENLMKADIQRYLKMQNHKTGMKFYDDLSEKFRDTMMSNKTGMQINNGFDVGDFIKKENGKFIRANNEAESIGKVSELVDNATFKYEKKDALKFSLGKNKATGEQINVKPLEVFFDAMQFLPKVFKLAKVPLNPASHTNAMLGNLTMSWMAGWNITKTAPLTAKMYKFLSGKAGANFVLNNFLQEGSDFAKFVGENPTAFKGTFGFAPSMLGGKYWQQGILKDLKASGVGLNKLEENAVMDAMHGFPNDIKTFLEGEAEKTSATKIKKGIPLSDTEKVRASTISEAVDPNEFKIGTPSSSARVNKEAGIAESVDDPSSAIRDLNIEGGAVMDYIKRKASESSIQGKVYSAIQASIEKGTNLFERHDQAAKLANAIHATAEGLSLDELRKLSRMIPEGISNKDIVEKILTVDGKVRYGDISTVVKGEKVVPNIIDGQRVYKLTWDKATDLANETHMNYAAMPAFVRMMRQMPLLGAPFVSFTYAAIPKTMKTLIHNPAAFNNIHYMLHEFGGDKTNAEKAAMNDKWNAWFKNPNLYKLPFGEDSHVYLNLTNALPYYSLSLLNPSQRNYSDFLPSATVKTIDNLQLMKTPGGQLIFDYFILPHLISQTDRPLGSMGQPLYPLDATGIQKAGYAARSLGEAYVPGAAGLLGLAGGKFAPGMTQYVPSYNYRKLAEGVQQNTALGIPSKDSATELTARNMSGFAGLPINKLNMDYLKNKSKKKK